MKTLVKRALVLTETDHQTNIKIPFVIENEADQLIIDFSYSPASAEDSAVYEKVQKALYSYVPLEERKKWATVDRHLPLHNLVTLSLSHDGQYIGARHRKATEQTIRISETGSSKGFLKHKINKGFWEVQLNVHCVASEKVYLQLLISQEEFSNESVPN